LIKSDIFEYKLKLKTMKKLIILSLILLSFAYLFISCGDDSTAPPPASDNEQPLTPGTAYLKFTYAPAPGGTTKEWTDSASFCLKNDSLVIVYVGTAARDTALISIYKPTATGNFSLGGLSISTSLIYLKSGSTVGSTYLASASMLVVTYFNTTNKTLKATFTDNFLVNPLSGNQAWYITNGTLKCTWF
jgi:hypothetical protein